MTWSVEFRGMGAGDSVGVDLYSPPVIGGSYRGLLGKGRELDVADQQRTDGFRGEDVRERWAGRQPEPAWLTYVVSGSNLILSWPSDRIGWKLQIQINPSQVGITTSWTPLPTPARPTSGFSRLTRLVARCSVDWSILDWVRVSGALWSPV